MALQRAAVKERLPVATHTDPRSVLATHQPPPPLLVRFLLIMGIFNARGFARLTLLPTPLSPSLGHVLVGSQGCPCDAWPRCEWKGNSLQRCYKALRVESMSQLGYLFDSSWGPSNGPLLGLTPLSDQSDPSLLVIYSSSSFVRIPRTPLVYDTWMSAFESQPTWMRFHVCVGWTTTLAGDDIGRPITLLSHYYANGKCPDVESNWSKILI